LWVELAAASRSQPHQRLSQPISNPATAAARERSCTELASRTTAVIPLGDS
jgi:hypothetical protein